MGSIGICAAKGRIEAPGYAPAAVRELVFLAAINVFYNRLATLPAVPWR